MTPLHFGLCFLFAACNMLYYQMYQRLVAGFTGDIILWGSVGSAVYLCSLGLGILRSDRTEAESCATGIGLIEVLISLWAPLAFVLLYLWHIIYRIYFYDFGQLSEEVWRRVGYFGVFAQLPLAYLGFLAGLESGFLSKLGRQHGLRRVQSLIALYYIGGLVGSFLLTLWLLPRVEPLMIVLACSGLNLLVALVWVFQDPASHPRQRAWLALGPAAFWSLLLIGVYGLELSQTQAKNFYYNHYSWSMESNGTMSFQFPKGPLEFWKQARSLPRIERHYGPYQVIDFVEKAEVKVPESRAWTMTMDGRFQVSSVYERSYHETLAHVPSALEGRVAPRILIVGGGDGLLARELLRFEGELEQITLVDIDPKILQLSTQHPRLLQLNQGSLLHPKLKVEARDAFTYLRRFQGEFDRIYLDILYPYNFESARLYSVEFLALVRQHLSPKGQVVMLSPLDFDQELRPEQDRTSGIILSTLFEAGFATTILFAEERHSFLLASSFGSELPDPATLERSSYISGIFRPDARPRYRQLPPYRNSRLVNSVLKPTFLGQKDSFF
jgi:spermidine synthase